MRLIDADKLCEDLLNRWSMADSRKEELIRQVMADIVTPIVVSQPTVNQWIPVFERLPNNRSEVIVSVNDGGIYTDSDWYSDDLGFYAYGEDVIAWMPLPELWKGEEE